MSIEFTGQWNTVTNILGNLKSRSDANLKIAIKKNAIMVRDGARKLIADTDKEWQELKPATITRKGSSKPLVDHGDLRLSIKEYSTSPKNYFVGVLKNAVNKDGDSMVDIAAVHEFGSDDGTIPMRSFLRKTYIMLYDKLVKNNLRAVEAALKGKSYSGR